MSNYEEQLFTEAVIQKANESVLYEMDCGDIPETGIFHVAKRTFPFHLLTPHFVRGAFVDKLVNKADVQL